MTPLDLDDGLGDHARCAVILVTGNGSRGRQWAEEHWRLGSMRATMTLIVNSIAAFVSMRGTCDDWSSTGRGYESRSCKPPTIVAVLGVFHD